MNVLQYIGTYLDTLNSMFRAIYSNLDKFQYTYGSGKFNIILKPPTYPSFVTYDLV